MRPTSLIGLAGLIVVGVIIADLVVHPQGGLLGAGAGKTR